MGGGEPDGATFEDVDALGVLSDLFRCFFRGWSEEVLVARSLYAGITINDCALELIYQWRTTFCRDTQFPDGRLIRERCRHVRY